MSFKNDTYAITAKEIIANLNKRNMEGYYCQDAKEATEKAISLMKKGASVAWGGSESIKECGLMDAVRNGEYDIIDRMQAVTDEEKKAMYARIVTCDYFLMSTNAITLDGELVNIDGNGNRVAPLIHGPENVIIIAGMNKVTEDVDSAYKRIKTSACPPNAVRLGKQIPCGLTGVCKDCLSPECFCNQIVVTRRSGHTGRIKVILVGEELGY